MYNNIFSWIAIIIIFKKITSRRGKDWQETLNNLGWATSPGTLCILNINSPKDCVSQLVGSYSCDSCDHSKVQEETNGLLPFPPHILQYLLTYTFYLFSAGICMYIIMYLLIESVIPIVGNVAIDGCVWQYLQVLSIWSFISSRIYGTQ